MAEYPNAVLYKPEPYMGCPNCEGNCWGAVDPFSETYVYRCHGHSVGMVEYPGCGTLFVIPKGLENAD